MKVIFKALALLAAILISPQSIAAVSFIGASAMVLTGVYILAGIGWALLAGSVPPFVLSVVLIRGMTRE